MKIRSLNIWGFTRIVCLSVLMGSAGVAFAASLPGSNFEIDTDANLKVDGTSPPAIDWANATGKIVKPDEPSGANDDSFGQGSKEDTAVPSPVLGSIPPNKSDLKTFGIYTENTGAKKFLHVFWHRVQEPSGTTNMDFEFNKSSTTSANLVTPVRTSGDVLLQYDLSQGGTNPTLWLSLWIDGTETPAPKTKADCEASSALPCWEKRINLSSAGFATGSINTTAILDADSAGLGPVSARTFGEASIDFSVFNQTGSSGCVTFGSAYLKSRSSDSFTSALKDFIAPISAQVSNCASLKVIKQDDNGQLLGGVLFQVFANNVPYAGSYNPSPGEDGNTVLYSCTTATTGSTLGTCMIANVLAGEYWVKESAAPAGYSIADPSSQRATVVAGGSEVELTFTNPRKPAKVTITKKDDLGNNLQGAGFQLYADNPVAGTFEGTDTPVAGKSCTTGANGMCEITGILPPGNYCVDETTVPAGYVKAAAQCFTLALDQNKLLSFVNSRSTGAIRITKTRKHAAAAIPGADPHAGVKFTITGGSLAAGVEVTTDANGTACRDGLVLSTFAGIGDYTVTETVPTGYVADGALAKSVTVSLASTCGDGNEAPVAFANTPKTNISVSATSQVTGGTRTSISCVLQGGGSIGSVAATGNPSLTVNDLLPGVYVCTIDIDP